MASEHREVEVKLDVPDDLDLPSLAGVGSVATVAPAVAHEMETTYYDTSDLALLRSRTTFRRRKGGQDDGWHLKQPTGDDERTETRLPLAGTADSPPQELVDLVRAWTGGAPLGPVATLRTGRVVHRLLDDRGGALADVCDDTVVATVDATAQRQDGATRTRWREWEVELVEGDRGLLATVVDELRRAGARPTGAGSKLARALGPRQQAAPDRCAGAPRGSAASVVQTYVAEQLRRIRELDPLVRADVPDAVHQMRVALRRTRSVLATADEVLDEDAARTLRDEMRWLAGLLGQARDVEVLRERLLAALQKDVVATGDDAAHLRHHLDGAHDAARADVQKALASNRYFRLLDGLQVVVTEPPRAAERRGGASTLLPALVRRDWRRLRRRARRAGQEPAPEALHDVRKAAKRLRYAAEMAEPAVGRPAAATAKRAKRLQQAAGEHHDAVQAQELLLRLGRDPTTPAATALVYGRLHAAQEQAAGRAVARYRRAWRRLDRRSRLRWLRR